MNISQKYDPEDIESLMLHKSFVELLPDEREFVLQHLASGSEYDTLRETLFRSIDTMQSDGLAPPPSLKRKVMAQYRAQQRGLGFGRIWLNITSLFGHLFRERPYVSLALAAVLVFFGVFFWLEPSTHQDVAVREAPTRAERKVESSKSEEQEEALAEPRSESTQPAGGSNTLEHQDETLRETPIESPNASPSPGRGNAAQDDLSEGGATENGAKVQARSQLQGAPAEAENLQTLDVVADESVAATANNVSADAAAAEEAEVMAPDYVNTAFLALLYTAR